MEEIRQSDCLTETDKEALRRAADVMDKMEREHPADILWEWDNNYVSFDDVAERFRELADGPTEKQKQDRIKGQEAVEEFGRLIEESSAQIRTLTDKYKRAAEQLRRAGRK